MSPTTSGGYANGLSSVRERFALRPALRCGVTTLPRVKIARPRLLAGSLAVAVLLIVAFAVVLATQASSDDDVDARLTPGVVTFPNDGLANANVEGDQLPVVDLGDRDGNAISTASFLGQPLVSTSGTPVARLASRSSPTSLRCTAEMGDAVRFIGVNTQDSVEEMERFAADRGVTYELYRDDFGDLVDAIRLVNTPTTLFVTA